MLLQNLLFPHFLYNPSPTSLLFKAAYYSMTRVSHFVYTCVSGQLGCFQLLALRTVLPWTLMDDIWTLLSVLRKRVDGSQGDSPQFFVCALQHQQCRRTRVCLHILHIPHFPFPLGGLAFW